MPGRTGALAHSQHDFLKDRRIPQQRQATAQLRALVSQQSELRLIVRAIQSRRDAAASRIEYCVGSGSANGSHVTMLLMRIIRELRRRRVFQTAALYIVGSWLVLQVCDVIFPALDIPDRALRYVLFGAILGFPASLVFGWLYDIGPGGISRTKPAEPDQTAPELALRKRDYVILTALIAVVAAVIYGGLGRFADSPDVRPAQGGSRDGPPTVAVLPFSAASPEEDSEFFADGIHDDLITQLSQLESLRVISRSSVLEYGDGPRNLQEIGEALGADVIVEGRIRSSGGRIRISAELADASTSENLWGRSYDRLLTPVNLFEVQGEIAAAIAAALQTTLTAQDQAQLAIIPTENMAAYRAYREALAIGEAQGRFRSVEYREALEKAVALDPEFTRAWAELAGALSFENFFFEFDMALTERAEVIIERLRTIAPGSADHLLAKAYYAYYTLKDLDQALALVNQVQSLRPSDLGVLDLKGWIQRRLGDYEGRTETTRLQRTLDPRDPTRTARLVAMLIMVHRYDEAQAEIDYSLAGSYEMAQFDVDLAVRKHGDMERWADATIALQQEYGQRANPYALWGALIVKGDFPAARRLADQIPDAKDEMLEPRLALQATTERLAGNEAKLAGLLAEAREVLADYETSTEVQIQRVREMNWGLVAALQGDREEAVRRLKRYVRASAQDPTALLARQLGAVCSLLGLAGAAEEAVSCLRRGFVEPSTIYPFIDPLMPHYDPIREHPAFRELISELRTDGLIATASSETSL